MSTYRFICFIQVIYFFITIFIFIATNLKLAFWDIFIKALLIKTACIEDSRILWLAAIIFGPLLKIQNFLRYAICA